MNNHETVLDALAPREVASPHRRSRFMAIMGQRCPRCREGRLFKSALRMNDPCLICGQVFEREPGYFLGAMYFSYGMATLYFVPVFFTLRWLLPDWPALLIP